MKFIYNILLFCIAFLSVQSLNAQVNCRTCKTKILYEDCKLWIQNIGQPSVHFVPVAYTSDPSTGMISLYDQNGQSYSIYYDKIVSPEFNSFAELNAYIATNFCGPDACCGGTDGDGSTDTTDDDSLNIDLNLNLIDYEFVRQEICINDTTVLMVFEFRDSILFDTLYFYNNESIEPTDFFFEPSVSVGRCFSSSIPIDTPMDSLSSSQDTIFTKALDNYTRIYRNFTGDITGQIVEVDKCKSITAQIFKFEDGYRVYPNDCLIINGAKHPPMADWWVSISGDNALVQSNTIDASTAVLNGSQVWLTTVGCESEEDNGFDCENLDCDTSTATEPEKRPSRITQINDDDKRLVEVRYDESLDCDDNPIDLTTAEFCQTFVFEDACRIDDENGNTISRSVNFTTAPIFTLCQTASTPTFDWSGSVINNPSDQALIESFFNFFEGGYQYDAYEIDDILVGIDIDGNIVGSGTDYLGILGFQRITQPSGCIYYEGAEWKIINATVKQTYGDCEGIVSDVETTELLVKKGIKAIAHSSTFLTYANDPQNSYSFYARSETTLNTCNFFSDSRVDNVQDNNGDYTVTGIPDSGVKFALYTHGDGSFLHTSNGVRKNGLTWENYALNHSPKSIPATGNDYLYDLVRSRVLNIYNTDYQINIRAIPSFLGNGQSIFSKLSDTTTVEENSSLRATRNNTGDLIFYPQNTCINQKIDIQRTIQFSQASGNEAPWDGTVSNQQFQITVTRTF